MGDSHAGKNTAARGSMCSASDNGVMYGNDDNGETDACHGPMYHTVGSKSEYHGR